MPPDLLLDMKRIVKKYPGVVALKGVDFSVSRQTVHCLIGENGAGKSTLIKILTGAERMTGGEMFFDGRAFLGRSVREAMNLGISTVFQELNVVDQLSVEENLTLGRERSLLGVIRKDPLDPVLRMMKEFAPDIALSRPVAALSFAEKQILEIVKAVGANSRLVVMDEPTAALSRLETERLYGVIRKLKARGISVLYISHALDDIFAVGDEVTVLRDGNVVGHKRVSQTTRKELIQLMVGRSVQEGYRQNGRMPGKPLLEVRELSTGAVHGISFTLAEGEILGFYGLRGAGKSEVARALIGLDRPHSGEIRVRGRAVSIHGPRQALARGISIVPEERLTEGLFMKLSVRENIAVTKLRDQSRFFVVNEKAQRATALKYMRDMNIKAHSEEQRAATLSGGNQQKVVISKCLNARARILLLDEPSRGIDVGSREEIYSIIRGLARDAAGVIVFSSEYDEIAALCDRVVLLAGGGILSTVDHQELDANRVHALVMGKGGQE